MGIIISTLSFLGYCLMLRRLTRWPIEATPFFVVSMIIICFYLSAYLNILQTTSLGVIGIGIVSLIAAPFVLPKQKQLLYTDYFTPGFIIFCCSITIFGLAAYHVANFNDADDLFWWMPHAKFLYTHHGFLQLNDIAIYKDYPPAGSLLYYYFLRLAKFSEGGLFYGHIFLIFSPLVILLNKFRWPNWYNAVLASLIVIALMIYLFEVPLGAEATTLMNKPLATFFGGIIASYYLMSNERGLWFYLTITAMALILFRPILYPFIGIIGFVILSDQFLIRKQYHQNLLPILKYLSIIIAPILLFKTWDYHITINQFAPEWGLVRLFSDIYHGTFELELSKFAFVISSFLHASIKALYFSIAMFICAGIIIWRTPDSFLKKRIGVMHCLLFCGFVLYLTLLLMFYLFQMPTVMAMILSSYSRFMYTYALGWFIVLLANLSILNLPSLSFFSSRLITSFKYLGIFCLAVYIYHSNLKIYKNNCNLITAQMGFFYNSKAYAEATKPIIEKLNTVNPDKIGFIHLDEYSNTTRTFPNERIDFAYALLPITPTFIQPLLLSNATLAEELKKLDYLILFNNNSNALWHDYDLNFTTSKQTPISSLSFCTKSTMDRHHIIHCTASDQKYVYLYKIHIQNGKLTLENLA